MTASGRDRDRLTARIVATVLTGAMLVLLGPAAFAAERSLRCGNDLIHPGMVAPEVTAKCGAPQSRDVEDVPVRVRNARGGVSVAGSTRVERWTYARDYGQFPALLTFEDGKLKTIELLTGR